MSKDTQSRKYQLTLNNPDKDNLSHDAIKTILQNFSSVVYWCMSDEKAQTPHTHLYLAFSGGVRFSTIKKHFPTAHIETAHGTSQENRDYISKSGKWENDEKHGTQIPDTFEEWGEMPQERQGTRSDLADIYLMLKEGASDEVIAEHYPDHYMKMDSSIERIRQKLRADEYREKWRDLEVTYIWGTTGAGKTRSVMENHGYSNVYHVNDYQHPFDGYKGESVILFDEFKSSLRVQDMNNYLDGYPLALPARYSNKQACYEYAFIISNIDLLGQYKTVQDEHPEVWAAFLRRIHKVVRFFPDGKKKEYTRQEYIDRSVKALAKKHAYKIKGGDL